MKSVKVYDTNKRQRMFDLVVGDNGKAVIVAKIGKQLYEVELEAVEKAGRQNSIKIYRA